MTRQALLVALGAVLLLGLGLRLARWQEERAAPLARAPLGDEGSYDRWARDLAAGRARPGPPYMAPLPAHLLAAAHRRLAPGAARDAYRLGAVALGVLAIGLAFLCGREVAGPRVGLVAAFLVATHRPLIYYEPTLLRDGPAAASLTLAAWALLRGRRAGPRGQVALAALAGLALGLGALVRENLFLVGVLAAAWAALGAWRARRRPAALAAVALALGLLGPSSPWLLAGVRAGQPSPLVTWNGGCVFYLHNRSGNLSSGYQAPPFVHASNPEGEQAGFRAEAERRAGRRLTPHQVSRYWLRAGLAEVAAAPGLYGLKLLGRLRNLGASTLSPQARDPVLDARSSRVLRLPSVGFGFLIAFASLGAALGGAGARRLALLAAATVGVTLLVAFLSRYRLVVVPLVCVLAAVGLAEVGRRLRTLTRLAAPGWAPDRAALAIVLSRRGAAARGLAGGLVALAVGLGLHLLPVPYRDTAGRQNRALAQLELGQPAAALETLLAAEHPSATTWALVGRAGALSRRWDLAEQGYRRLLALAPERLDGWLGLALALQRQGRRSEARAALAQARRLDPREPLIDALERRLR